MFKIYRNTKLNRKTRLIKIIETIDKNLQINNEELYGKFESKSIVYNNIHGIGEREGAC